MSDKKAREHHSQWTRLLRAAYNLHPQFRAGDVTVDAFGGLKEAGRDVYRDEWASCISSIYPTVNAQAKALARALYLVVTDFPEVMAFRIAGKIPNIENWARQPENVDVAVGTVHDIVRVMAEHIFANKRLSRVVEYIALQIPLSGRESEEALRLAFHQQGANSPRPFRFDFTCEYSLQAILALPKIRQMADVLEQTSKQLDIIVSQPDRGEE